MVSCSNGEECKSFTVSGAGVPFTGGRYVAKTFGIAAKRAGSKIYSKINNDPEMTKYKNKNSVKFILKETTKGSPKSTKAYQVKRTELKEPKVIKRNGVKITYKFKYTVNELKVDVESLSNEMM